nr:unnamed protein product [Callosobruchus analis]
MGLRPITKLLTKHRRDTGCPKTAEIVELANYINIINDCAKVLEAEKDFKVFDWRTETQKLLKPTSQWYFKFQPAKKFILSKNKSGMVLVRGEAVYRTDLGEAKGILIFLIFNF